MCSDATCTLTAADTTVMEKAITYPTDSKLYLKSLQRMNQQAKAHGIKLCQSYTRTAKHLAIKAGRDAHARQYRRMRKALKQLKGSAGDAMHVVPCAPRLILRAIEAFFARSIIGLREQLLSLGTLPRFWGMHSFQCDGTVILLIEPLNKSGNHSCLWLPA